jgi:hypothetical protein
MHTVEHEHAADLSLNRKRPASLRAPKLAGTAYWQLNT